MRMEVVVVGRPVPKGSLQRGIGRSLYFPARVKEWERLVRSACSLEMKGLPLIEAKCSASLRFFIKPTAAGRLIGDLDKLVRGVLDAMTGIVYDDDERVTQLIASKLAVEPGHEERADVCVSIVEA